MLDFLQKHDSVLCAGFLLCEDALESERRFPYKKYDKLSYINKLQVTIKKLQTLEP